MAGITGMSAASAAGRLQEYKSDESLFCYSLARENIVLNEQEEEEAEKKGQAKYLGTMRCFLCAIATILAVITEERFFSFFLKHPIP